MTQSSSTSPAYSNKNTDGCVNRPPTNVVEGTDGSTTTIEVRSNMNESAAPAPAPAVAAAGAGAAAVEENRKEHGTEEKQQLASSSEDPPPYIAPPELRMSKQEEEWTWDIVYWVETKGEEEGVKKPTDFEFVLYALATKGNTEDAVERMKGMQRFKEMYNVQDTVEEGLGAIRDFIRLQPGVLLHLDAFRGEGVVVLEAGSIFVADWGKFAPAVARQNMPETMLFLYYSQLICCAPNFDSARGGTRKLMEIGSGFKRESADLELLRLCLDGFLRHYPVDYREIRLYNTNFFFNWAMMMVKPFMNKQMRDSFQYGCQIEIAEGDEQPFEFIFNSVPRMTLADVYLRPNYEVAMENLLTKAETHLTEYYHNLDTFEF